MKEKKEEKKNEQEIGAGTERGSVIVIVSE